MAPNAAKDQYSNAVVKRNGHQTDPDTGLPYEVWMKSPRMEFVFIPAGEFRMGSESGDPDEKPVFEVRLTRPFYMGKYEVTQGQWSAVMYGRKSPALSPEGRLSSYGCQVFVRKLGLRLPTEAEREYACRAGSTTAFCFGDKEGQLREYAWYAVNSWSFNKQDYGRRVVGAKRPNAWGLYDMHGGVCEWCQDWYGKYESRRTTDPEGPPGGYWRVLRGGGFWNEAAGCRSASRFKGASSHSPKPRGLRPVKSFP